MQWTVILSLHLNFIQLKKYQNRCHIFLNLFIFKLKIFIKNPNSCHSITNYGSYKILN